MTAKEAVSQRILEISAQKGIAVNAMANNAGISPSTIYSILNRKSMNPGIVTLYKICIGLDTDLHKFFDSPLFDDLDEEVQ